VLLAALAAAPLSAAPIHLDPTFAGSWNAGTGAYAQFHAIDPAWHDSSVYWSEETRSYSAQPAAGYARIGDLGWGIGLWGLADWERVQPGEVPAIASWSGGVARIDHANEQYRSEWGGTAWGDVSALPDAIPATNWTAHYSGYLRITDDGDYNFGVLYDDGFFLRIHGADGQVVEISSDFIVTARERLGFADDLSLTEGLYRFELGAYNRLEAGVVQLAWFRDGGWETVPTEHLVIDPTRIALPGTLAMMAIGGLGIVATRKRPLR
jgi:hypothetical protein